MNVLENAQQKQHNRRGSKRRRLVDVNEAARLTGLEQRTLYKLAHRGRLRSFTAISLQLKFDRADLVALVEEKPERSSTT